VSSFRTFLYYEFSDVSGSSDYQNLAFLSHLERNSSEMDGAVGLTKAESLYTFTLSNKEKQSFFKKNYICKFLGSIKINVALKIIIEFIINYY
jgi:hypothetical protein